MDVRTARWRTVLGTMIVVAAISPIVAQQENVGEMVPIKDAAEHSSDDSRVLYLDAVAAFRQLEMAESARFFDLQIAAKPDDKPELWERGIALYYAERWADCADQFESHHTVNPGDVENAVWHYLCVAKTEGHEVARERMYPQDDSRVPMPEVWGLFRGTKSVDDVLAAAEKTGAPDSELRQLGRFHAHLYIALWHESNGDSENSLAHLQRGLQGLSSGHFMEMVARAHLQLRRRQALAP
ncbi:MAG: hypothetical protein OEV00_00245 [Acidobacteriota bacterium]|nr:hypothetical protein [Acidobacteriota bacterium]MDH3783733.1 hypothetical protein [Acidobacteriota bacterium]